jgi:hypothetical protein
MTIRLSGTPRSHRINGIAVSLLASSGVAASIAGTGTHATAVISANGVPLGCRGDWTLRTQKRSIWDLSKYSSRHGVAAATP